MFAGSVTKSDAKGKKVVETYGRDFEDIVTMIRKGLKTRWPQVLGHTFIYISFSSLYISNMPV